MPGVGNTRDPRSGPWGCLLIWCCLVQRAGLQRCRVRRLWEDPVGFGAFTYLASPRAVWNEGEDSPLKQRKAD